MELTEVHPLFVHFPIALLSVGYFFDVLYVVFKKTELEILFNEGISKEGEILDLGVTKNILEKNGSFFLLLL